MDYTGKPCRDDLRSFLHGYRKCEECTLHKNRKHMIQAKGSIHASVVILLDRVSVDAACSGNIMDGAEGKVLQQVLKFVAEDYPLIRDNYLWVTSVVSCPTQKLGGGGRTPEMLPTPGLKHQAACYSRLCGEINRIQPEIIVACGSAAAKAIKVSGSHEENLGRVAEAKIVGSIEYVVPAMVTYSMNQLLRNPTQNARGMWNKTVGHMKQAISISETLLKRRS